MTNLGFQWPKEANVFRQEPTIRGEQPSQNETERENAGLGRAWAWKIWYLHIHCLAIIIPFLMLKMVYTHVYTIFRHTCFATQLLIHEPKLKIHILLVGLHRFENGTRVSNPVKHILTAQIHVYIQFTTRPQPWGYYIVRYGAIV